MKVRVKRAITCRFGIVLSSHRVYNAVKIDDRFLIELTPALSVMVDAKDITTLDRPA